MNCRHSAIAINLSVRYQFCISRSSAERQVCLVPGPTDPVWVTPALKFEYSFNFLQDIFKSLRMTTDDVYVIRHIGDELIFPIQLLFR